jgi:hypothetical protein
MSKSKLKPKEKRPPSTLKADEREFISLFSLSRLRRTWSTVRRELRQVSMRDAVDWIDWVHTIESSLTNLLDEVRRGSYQPCSPTRYELAKSMGSFRSMTFPNIRDTLIYRHISDEILARATPHKVKGAFFSRRFSATPIGPRFELGAYDDSRFFEIWLRYQEYRTRTMLNSPYKILVVTDIMNYFDSIQHELLMEYLAPLGLPRKAIALLGRLIEVLKPTSGHSPNPRVGLPVDELDCSRQIAHVFLFEHDQRIVKFVGEDHFVRWMDDQNAGVRSMTEARKLVNLLTRSLAEQRLTLNAGKTRFLPPDEVVSEFHLDTNQSLTEWYDRWKKAPELPNKARSELRNIWDKAPNKGRGQWEKILKRFYACVAITGDSWLDDLALSHLIDYPGLSGRIFESFAKRGEIEKLIVLFRQYVNNRECLYEATEAMLFDALLLADATRKNEKLCLDLAHDFLHRELRPTSKRPLGMASAVLCYYWFGGDADDLPKLLGTTRWVGVPDAVVRAILATTAARGPATFRDLLPHIVGHPSDDVGRLVQFIDGIQKGRITRINKFAHLKPRWPLRGRHYDARAWLCFEILAHCPNKKVRLLLRQQHKTFAKYVATRQEKRVSGRIEGLLRS